MRKILFIHSAGDLYGSGKIMLFAIDALQANGYSCKVCLPVHGPLVNELKDRGCEVFIIELGILRRKYLSLGGIINRVLALTKAVFKIRRLIKRHNIDLVYSNTTAVLCGAFASKISRVKHIWHIHEIIESPHIFVKFLSLAIQHLSDKAVAVSTPVKKHWEGISKKDIHEDVIEIIYNGLPLDEFEIVESKLRAELQVNKDSIIVGMVGRVHHWKGQGYFLEMANILNKKFNNIVFVMVGDAFPGYEYLYDELKELKNKYKLNAVVFDMGYRRDIPNILKGFDIFVLPSTSPDPLPTVVLESMGMSLPVVATKHGGALEMVKHGETGYLIPWEDAVEGAEYIGKLVMDPSLRARFGKQGRAHLENNFSLPSFKRNIIKLIHSVFKKNSKK